MVIMKGNNTLRNDVSYIALGSFDGIHQGHVSLVKKIVELAKENNGKSVVFTFKNHPREVLIPHSDMRLLINNIEKEKIIKSYNVDKVYFQEFTEEFMKYTPEEFIKYIKNKFNVAGIVVGFNFRFGYKNLGDTKLLKELSKKYNYDLYVMPPCKVEDQVISSTIIRNLLVNGDIEDANKMLGRPYILKGIVVEGRKIGRTINFPTANVQYDKINLLPKNGVYYTNVVVNNEIYKAITNIGDNPTVNGQKITLESYILDFDDNIYGKEMEVHFLKRIRNMIKFESLDELKLQLEKDKNYAKKEKSIYNNKSYLQI